MKIIPKSEWGGRAAKSGATSQTVSKITRVTIHHTTGSSGDGSQASSAKLIRGHQNYHMDRNGWKDIGYHFIVDKKGRIFQGLALTKVGAHAEGYNTNNIGIAYLGDASKSLPTAAKNAIRELYAYLVVKVGKNLAVYGHRDLNNTSCPGNAAYKWLKAELAYNGRYPKAWRPVPVSQPEIPVVEVPVEEEQDLPTDPIPGELPDEGDAEAPEPNENRDLLNRVLLAIQELLVFLKSVLQR